MKKVDIQEAIQKVVLDVFENMYFMFPEVVTEDDPMPSIPKSCFKASVTLKNGSELFVLYAFEQLVADMAKNFLGTDKAIGETDLIDVFQEAANVIAGNFITRIGLNSSIAFNIPVAERSQDCSELRTDPGAQGVVFDFGDQFLKVTVMIANK